MSIPIYQFIPLPFPPWYQYVCSLPLKALKDLKDTVYI